MSINFLNTNNKLNSSNIAWLDVFFETKKLQLHQVLWSVYTKQEFNKYRWHIPWSLYLLDYKPEILNYKEILEKARYTGKVESITLEWEWNNGFVVQVSDICIKFKNQGSTTDFNQEKKNYKTVENIYNDYMTHQNLFKIPWLQRHISDDDMIVMEYIPGFTLAHTFILKDKNIKEKNIIEFLNDDEYWDYDDILLINQRLKSIVKWNKTNMYNNLFDKLKDHELRTILLYLWIQQDEIDQISSEKNRDNLIEYCTSQQTQKEYNLWKKVLLDNGIIHIDDHAENLKVYNSVLYGLDFWNITFLNPLKWEWSILLKHR